VTVGLVLGCGSQKVASVSGRVTLNNQPLADATVSFQPIAPAGKMIAGPGSTGKTDADGRYTLTLMSGQSGAVVGQHQVTITALNPKIGDADERETGPRRGGPELADKVPARYGPGEKNELKFDVPPGGTNKADFTLTSP
jgi:hypothetical protein